MPELKLNVINDLSTEGINGELRAIKLAIGLLAAKIPLTDNADSIVESLNGTGDVYAAQLAELINSFLLKSKES
ncbi:TPA: hypothetical protein N6141_001284 [Escherichia coli]|nr:hypothetical protein [Escherichia coli]HCN6960439.1 hypothetical protein [Escherichia coli]HCN7013179.1 hypothetical protein [Escherichia coli]